MAANAVSGSLKTPSLGSDSLCLCLRLCCCLPLQLPSSLCLSPPRSLSLFSRSLSPSLFLSPSRYLASFTCSLNCKRVQQHKTLSRLYLFMGHTWAASSPSFSLSPFHSQLQSPSALNADFNACWMAQQPRPPSCCPIDSSCRIIIKSANHTDSFGFSFLFFT